MVYRAARGAQITDEQAQIYGERIETLVEEGDGSITPERVYDDAKDKASPLHEYFEWNNKVAADNYRMAQAHELLRFIHVVITHDGVEEEVRAFHNVVITHGDDQPGERTYASLARVLSDDELRRQILVKAMREFEQWHKRYNQYQELAPIFQVYETVKETVKAQVA